MFTRDYKFARGTPHPPPSGGVLPFPRKYTRDQKNTGRGDIYFFIAPLITKLISSAVTECVTEPIEI